MGIRHSKPRLRRRRSGRGRRWNPEGSSSPSPDSPVKEGECEETCPCNKPRNNGEEMRPQLELQRPDVLKKEEQLDPNLDLRVSLPCENQNSSPHSAKEEKSAEWLLSLPRDLNDQSRNEKISRLMDSIRDVVGSEMDGCGPDRSVIRVRLAVTPEPRQHAKVDNSSHQQTSTRRRNSDGCSPTRSLTSRSRHYQQISGTDEPGCSSNHTKAAANHNYACASRDHRQKERQSANQSRSRSRDHPRTSCCRRHGRCHHNRSKLKSDRFQSPFDRRFQEAMYLRLTELQRKTARQRRRAEDPNITDSDSDDDVVATKNAADSEYSGDDDNGVVGEKTEKQCSRMFEPLSALSLRQEKKAENLVGISDKSRLTSGTNHCFTFDSPPSGARSPTKVRSSSAVVKPWDESHKQLQSGKRKTLRKRRSDVGSSKPAHGYLREDALTKGGVGFFPCSPKMVPEVETKKKDKSSGPPQKHEHFHYHYYYCKPDT